MADCLSNSLVMKRNILVVVLAMCCWTTADAAGYLRCHGKLIRPGVSAAYILAICGPPERQLIQQVPARSRTVTGFSRLTGIAVSEQWIYDRGKGRFPAVLEFHEGKLRRIELLPHRS